MAIYEHWMNFCIWFLFYTYGDVSSSSASFKRDGKSSVPCLDWQFLHRNIQSVQCSE